MEKLLMFIVGVFVTVITATGVYIAGRILLPEIGLTAPGWIPWFWATAAMMISGILVQLGIAFVKEL